MTAQLSMLDQMTLPDTNEPISSPALAAGITPSISRDGRVASGPAHAPVNRSQLRGRKRAPTTTATCGPSGESLSNSNALQRSLESRLRERMGSDGCPAFVLTWKITPMPLGSPICALLASENGIDAKDCIGLPSPITKYDGRSMSAWRIAKARAKERHEQGLYGKGTGAPGMIDLQRRLRLLLGCEDGKVTPAFAAWMMGYPETWLSTAPSVTQ